VQNRATVEVVSVVVEKMLAIPAILAIVAGVVCIGIVVYGSAPRVPFIPLGIFLAVLGVIGLMMVLVGVAKHTEDTQE
jgi:hypothetical protein